MSVSLKCQLKVSIKSKYKPILKCSFILTFNPKPKNYTKLLKNNYTEHGGINMNIKKARRDVETIREIFMDLANDPEDKELLEELDYFLKELQLDVYYLN